MIGTVRAAGATAHLAADSVTRIRGDRTVLNGISLTVSAGERLGLIGDNGVGKSTLLRVLAGLDAPDGGLVRAGLGGGTPGYLSQEPDLPAEWDLARCLAEARRELDRIAGRMHEVELLMSAADEADLAALLDEYAVLQEDFEARDGWRFEARAFEVFQALGLHRLPSDRLAGQLSGGERARLGLALLVLQGPPALLLDEPTNHLDDEAVEWLAGWLREFRGPCLIASHDRDLLDGAVTGLLDLDGPRGSVVRYGGTYRDYAAAQAAARRRWEADYENWTESLAAARLRLNRSDRAAGHYRPPRDNAKMNYDLRGAGAQAAVARTARAAKEEIRRLELQAVPRPPAPLSFTAVGLADRAARGAEEAGQEAGPLIELRDVRTAQGIRLPELALTGTDRLVVAGPNGAGKSTLLRVLAGELEPAAGTVATRPGVRVGHLPQESDYPAGRVPLLRTYAQAVAATEDEAAEQLLELGLFRPADLQVPVGALSAGQRRRLDLARLVAMRPHVLLLDEPTNHLSLPLIEDLQTALDEFPGPVVTVTHDRRMRRSAGRTLMLERD
ncbi:ABC-F family ATP-binding cassette domain-containing protein [Streptomyces sp. BR123]|uniref:ABC-F family ATP-binding cassette domain-containing protein n=1 Tax=Streptomyces sp. BR123 TaxID=2749828 RepID=UPI0015C4349F|nr:ABC-F family ATP-binding cassette domain-containing protein [Streptomyces sp. BR123]NXY94833.1 ABC-F family ATP-binding cassette domain-containing protein [Streptomyces sp. BR123]